LCKNKSRGVIDIQPKEGKQVNDESTQAMPKAMMTSNEGIHFESDNLTSIPIF
jgi:hypothetical protein